MFASFDKSVEGFNDKAAADSLIEPPFQPDPLSPRFVMRSYYAAIASSVNQTVRLPRCLKAASSEPFVTKYRGFGIG